MSRKIQTIITLCAAFAFAVPAWALPETVGEWHSESEEVIPFVLDANSEDMGRWTQRVYTRENPRGVVEVNLMEGAGPGPLRVCESVVSCDAVFEAKSEYHILEVAGRRAILERQPLLPLALAVSMGPDRTLTLEGHVTEEELSVLARQLMDLLKKEIER